MTSWLMRPRPSISWPLPGGVTLRFAAGEGEGHSLPFWWWETLPAWMAALRIWWACHLHLWSWRWFPSWRGTSELMKTIIAHDVARRTHLIGADVPTGIVVTNDPWRLAAMVRDNAKRQENES